MENSVLLRRLEADIRPLWQARSVNFIYRWQFSQQSFIEGLMARITNEEQVKVTVVAKTAAGNPARIDGVVEFTSSDEAVVAVEQIDAMSAMVKSIGPGVAQIKAVFDADLGEGVRAVEMSGAVEVVEAEAAVGEITFGAPELKV